MSTRIGEGTDIMTVRDAAEYLNCHQSTIYRLLREGVLRSAAFRLGGSWRIRRQALIEWMEKGGAEQAAA